MTQRLELMREAGGDVIGLDWCVRLDEGWQRVGHDMAITGNLDPVALFAKRDVLRAQAKRILTRCDELNVFEMVDAQLAMVEGELLAKMS